MNIIRKKSEKHLFNEVDVGRTFEYDNDICMRFKDIASNGRIYNAICLEDGALICFMGDELIQFVDADLVIKY